MALVPARAWDELGRDVTPALQAPFLIDSGRPHEQGGHGSDLVDGMLAGLGCRQASGARPLAGGRSVTRWDSSDRSCRLPTSRQVIRAPHSEASFELLRALGAEPVDLSGRREARHAEAAQDGQAAGPSRLLLASRFRPRNGPRRTSRSSRRSTHSSSDTRRSSPLDASQQSILRDAAAQTLDHVRRTPRRPKRVAKACADGVAVVPTASAEDLSALEKAAQPVSTRLEEDRPDEGNSSSASGR